GWSLVLEYTVAAAAVAVGWSGHAESLITAAGWGVPPELLHGYFSGGLMNIPAILIAGVVTLLLIAGTRESATLNIFLVLIKLSALVLFVVLAVQSFDAANFTPFAPFGYGATQGADGKNYGVLGAAAIVFFAFYGFDTVSTAAEETKNPERNLTIGIVGSMALCTAIYVVVAMVAVGAMSYTQFSATHDAAPLVFMLQSLSHGTAAQIVAACVVIAIPSVILVLMYGQSRIFFVMARDGLLPQFMATVSKSRGTPILMTTLTGLVVIAMAATMDLSKIVELANVGTLTAFIAVAASMLVLRVRDPNRPRLFRTPLPWVVGPVCILGCLYLAWSLPTRTQIWFFEWNGIGLVLYFLYGMRASRLAKAS